MERINFQPSFGSVRYIVPKKEIDVYIARHVCSIPKSIEGDKLLRALEKHPEETELSYAFNRKGNPKLCACVGEKCFTENIFFGPITVLKKALKAANKLAE